MKLIKLAEYGGDEFLICTLSCGALAFVLRMADYRLALLPLIPWLIVVWFFRDPNRTGESNPEWLLSPADGTVSDIEEMDEIEFLGTRAVRIGIFLSPFNVHVNRAPGTGTVGHIKYKTGEFLPAYKPEAPYRNESVAMGIELENGVRILVKQVTGLLARRIICESQPGDKLERGQRYGMIKFGSRTELYVPVRSMAENSVKIGDVVWGGHSVLCRIKAPPVDETPAKASEWNVSAPAQIPGDVAPVGSAVPQSDIGIN